MMAFPYCKSGQKPGNWHPVVRKVPAWKPLGDWHILKNPERSKNQDKMGNFIAYLELTQIEKTHDDTAKELSSWLATASRGWIHRSWRKLLRRILFIPCLRAGCAGDKNR
jgi:hypothetical protein